VHIISYQAMKSINELSRRNFIKTTALGIGALALAPLLKVVAINKPAKRLGIALVGLGSYSTGQLAPALMHTKNCYLAGIVSGSPAKANSWAAQYQIKSGNIYNYENFDQIIHNTEIDIVYIVLPVFLHKEFTIRAARAGKHVICEKPMALNAAECKLMIKACNEQHRLLSIGYRLHFEPHNLEVMRLGQQKIMGNIVSLDTGNGFTYHGDPKAWRLKKALGGGGGLMDMGIYSIQGTRYSLGKEPIAVKARQEKLRPDFFTDVDETVFWELEFDGGLKTTGKSSYNNDWSYLKVEASQGNFELGPAYGYGSIKGVVNGKVMQLPNIIQQAAQMDDFAECVNTNKESRVAGMEGLKDMLVVDAIYKSLGSGNWEKIST